MPLFSLLSFTSTVAHPTPCTVHRHAFPQLLVLLLFCLFYLTLIWCFLLLFLCLWNQLATGLAENLTQLVFREPFVIQHVRTRSLNCETWNFWCFHNIINMKIIWDLWCYCISSCSIHVISWFESQKCMNNPYHTYHNIIAIRS